MTLSNAQLLLIKNWIIANMGGVFDAAARDALNAVRSPAYYAHRTDLTRVEIYRTTVPAALSSTGAETVWSWAGFKAQGVPEQNAWNAMFMAEGGALNAVNFCDLTYLNNRDGVREIFGTTGNGGANRAHVFNVGRRAMTVFEHLFAAAVVAPPANTGNTTGQARGSLQNPDTFGLDQAGAAIKSPVSLATVQLSESATA